MEKYKINQIVDKNYKAESKEDYIERIFDFGKDANVGTDARIQNMNVCGKQDILNFWKSDPELYNNLSFETVLNSFGGYYDHNEFSKKEIVNTIMEHLKRKLEEEQQIYNYNIQLFNISKIDHKIQVGDFEILNKDAFLDLFTSNESKIWRREKTSDDAIFWSCNLKVSEKYRGLELIEEYIRLFTNSIRVLYMVTNPKRSINFFNGNNQSARDVVILNQSGMITGPSKRDKVFDIVNLQDKIFNKFDPIWDKLFRINTQNNEIFKRIQNSLIWLGESMEEIRTEQAFVKAIISLEGLIGKKGNVSIAENLATNVAVVLSDDYESRMEMKKKVKNLYIYKSINVLHSYA